MDKLNLTRIERELNSQTQTNESKEDPDGNSLPDGDLTPQLIGHKKFTSLR